MSYLKDSMKLLTRFYVNVLHPQCRYLRNNLHGILYK